MSKNVTKSYGLVKIDISPICTRIMTHFKCPVTWDQNECLTSLSDFAALILSVIRETGNLVKIGF